ncbi:hypothetical protein [Stappia sp.]|uniref:hypothetical protein n=1 Tax=Stappia sp. TaxID=1870903 RepID=UPI003C7C1D0F
MTWTVIAVLAVVGLLILMIAADARGLRDAARDTDETYTPPRQPHRKTRGPGRSRTQDPARPASPSEEKDDQS